MKRKEVKMTKLTAIMILTEYQDLRMGRNEYDWKNYNSPECMKKFPYDATQLSLAIDKAIDALEMSISKKKG
jgi:hypothetical protein